MALKRIRGDAVVCAGLDGAGLRPVLGTGKAMCRKHVAPTLGQDFLAL